MVLPTLPSSSETITTTLSEIADIIIIVGDADYNIEQYGLHYHHCRRRWRQLYSIRTMQKHELTLYGTFLLNVAEKVAKAKAKVIKITVRITKYNDVRKCYLFDSDDFEKLISKAANELMNDGGFECQCKTENQNEKMCNNRHRLNHN